MEQVLYIGPDYKDHRGGIAAVLEVYAKHISDFKFIRTYANKPFVTRFFIYIQAVFSLIWKLATDRTIKIVHIHTASRGSFMRKSLLALISKLFRRKAILHVHGGSFHIFYKNAGILRKYIRFIIGTIDVLVCLSEKWKEFFSNNFRIKKLAIINNVIEQPVVSGQAQIKNGHIRLLFLGYIGEEKGIFDLLDVLHTYKDDFREKFVLTVGGNGEVDRLKENISKYHMDGFVEYAGWVNGEKKNDLLQNCDIYVLPSYNEGLPISVLEAISYSKPVISTIVGGIPEIVRSGYNGWLFKPGDRQGLRSVLQEAMNSGPVLEEYGRNSRHLSEYYTPRAVFESLDDLYRQLIIE